MKKVRVQFTERENGYQYTNEWYDEIVTVEENENENDAIDILKIYISENNVDPNIYIYKI